jgi:hypothetical protein
VSELLDAITQIDTRVVLVAALLVLDVWAIGMTLASDAGRKEKVLWSGIVILCPIFGCLFWFSLGPKPNLIGTGPSSEPGAAD